MSAQHGWQRILSVIAVFIGVWLGLRVLFPLFLPFLLGWFIAVLALPPAKLLQKKLHFRRNAACFFSVTAVLALLLGAAGLLVSLTVREAAALAGDLSGLAGQLSRGVDTARSWAVNLASRAPEGLSGALEQVVENLFSSGSGILERGAGFLLDLAGRVAEGLPRGLVLLGTAVLSGYLIAPRLPELSARLAAWPSWQRRWRPALLRLRSSAGQWLRAQLKLSGVTFLIVLAGYLILGVENVLPLAVLTALVDAVCLAPARCCCPGLWSASSAASPSGPRGCWGSM